MSQQPPERVRVTGPPQRRTPPRRAGTGEIDAGTRVGEIYMGSLLREQGWLAVRILALLAATVGSLPLLFHLIPGLASVRLLGLPLPWLLIGVLVYPWLLVLGWRYVRAAEANERDFASLVGGRPPAPAAQPAAQRAAQPVAQPGDDPGPGRADEARR